MAVSFNTVSKQALDEILKKRPRTRAEVKNAVIAMQQLLGDSQRKCVSWSSTCQLRIDADRRNLKLCNESDILGHFKCLRAQVRRLKEKGASPGDVKAEVDNFIQGYIRPDRQVMAIEQMGNTFPLTTYSEAERYVANLGHVLNPIGGKFQNLCEEWQKKFPSGDGRMCNAYIAGVNNLHLELLRVVREETNPNALPGSLRAVVANWQHNMTSGIQPLPQPHAQIQNNGPRLWYPETPSPTPFPQTWSRQPPPGYEPTPLPTDTPWTPAFAPVTKTIGTGSSMHV